MQLNKVGCLSSRVSRAAAHRRQERCTWHCPPWLRSLWASFPRLIRSQQLPLCKHESTPAPSLQVVSDGEVTTISGHLHSPNTENKGPPSLWYGSKPAVHQWHRPTAPCLSLCRSCLHTTKRHSSQRGGLWSLPEAHPKTKNTPINILSRLIHITRLNSYFQWNLRETKRKV